MPYNTLADTQRVVRGNAQFTGCKLRPMHSPLLYLVYITMGTVSCFERKSILINMAMNWTRVVETRLTMLLFLLLQQCVGLLASLQVLQGVLRNLMVHNRTCKEIVLK